MNQREPERLRILGATDLEQRLLAAAGAETPSPELTRRMARGLGLAAGVGVATASSTTAATPATVAGASGLAWPLVSAGVAALAVASAVVAWSGTHRARPAAVPTRAPAAMAAAPAPVAPALEPAAAAHPHRHHVAPAAPAGDLRAEIALLDAARAAASGGDDARALALLRRYDATFPAGTFRPESTALQVEALAHLGRTERARALARSFVAAHPDSPLVGRVQRAIPRDP